MSVNKVILIGNLGADPEIKHLEGDRAVANIRLATNESYTDRSGQRVELTEWHQLEVWGNQAKVAEKYLRKGSKIYVEGRIRTEKWQDRDGNNRYTTRIRVDRFQMLDSKDDGGNANDNSSGSNSDYGDDNGGGAHDDLPF